MWIVYGSTFNLCGTLYTGSTVFIYGWSSSLNFLDTKRRFFNLCGPITLLGRGGGGGGGGGGGSSSFNFLDTKKAIVLALLKT